MPLKAYTAPQLNQLIAVPPVSHVTVYEFTSTLAEWYLPDLVALRDLLCKAQGVPINTAVMLRAVDLFIDQALEKVS